ncbi:uncharacterized protein LOC134250844, partial [Saccostrea cucullata]|uniref:uncharacterized protein LOC134250844 n=1 Tax=Saccostrea cuccullata TaxID=36930 RepID=UPI002ED3B68D
MEKRQGLMRYQQKPSKLRKRQPLTSYTTSSTRSWKKRTSWKSGHGKKIATLRIIMQSLEWKSHLYVNFIEHEKAFDSVDREPLWKILRHYGVPDKLVSLIRNTSQGIICRVAQADQMSDNFELKTEVRQGYDLALLSHNQSKMQDKTTRLATTSAGTGLKINLKKTELMKINTTVQTPVTVGDEPSPIASPI